MSIRARVGMMRKVDFMQITFICTGNTCRSAMAQGICRKTLADRGLEGFTVKSCGLAAFPGDNASPNAIKAAKKLGADISDHRATPISTYILDETDVAVCMTQGHKAAVMSVGPKCRVLVPESGISDPYGGDESVYDKCAAQLKVYIEKLIDSLTADIVPMREAHVSQIAEIEKRCFSAPWSEKSIAEEINNETAKFLVSVSGDRVLGYIGVHEVCGEAYIANIAVLPEYRRLGIAEALLKAAENGAKGRGCEFISLEVRKSNLAAITLYKKRGYAEAGERKNFYTDPQEDGIIMTLNFGGAEN